MYVDGKHTKQIKVQKNWFLRICSIDRALLRYDARHKRSILCLLFALLFFLMLSKSFCVCFSCRLIVHIPIVGMFCASKMKMFFRIITSVSKNSIKTNLFVCLEIVHLDEINTEPTAYFGISFNLRV